ncbi:hypothetical protein [Streptomyces avermitilis]|uniref:hypothetical protein n=1 Tax=Streptomyces avermitilis TaxID=33903 RepID=UPI0033DD88AC
MDLFAAGADVVDQEPEDVAEPDLDGRTTDPATWIRSSENLARITAFSRKASARRRAIADRKRKAPAGASGS